MATKKTARSSKLPSNAGYEGLCSRFTDLVDMKHMTPSSTWEMHVVDRTLTILKYDRPDLLDEIKKAVRENYENCGKRMPEGVGKEGKTLRCPTCNKTW